MTTMNSKKYIIAFSEIDFDNEDFIEYINGRSEISFWFTFIKNTIIVTTELNSKEIFKLIKVDYPNKKLLITKIDDVDIAGFMPKKYINYFKKQ